MILPLAPELKVTEHVVTTPRFPVIYYHNHLDSLEPEDVLRIMDACGVERLINITMLTGHTALDVMDSFHRTAPDRFHSYGWMDWSGVEHPDFIQLSLCAR